jgi:hypothetical protein
MDDDRSKDLTEELRELAAYFATSARGLLDEPPSYGPFRMIDGISRLVVVLEKYGLSDQTLSDARAQIDRGKTSVMTSPDDFRKLLDSLVNALTDD